MSAFHFGSRDNERNERIKIKQCYLDNISCQAAFFFALVFVVVSFFSIISIFSIISCLKILCKKITKFRVSTIWTGILVQQDRYSTSNNKFNMTITFSSSSQFEDRALFLADFNSIISLTQQKHHTAVYLYKTKKFEITTLLTIFDTI